MTTTTKQVATSMTFEVTVHLSAIETEDETGADISRIELAGVDVEDVEYSGWIDALKHMTNGAEKGEWNHD